MTFSKWLTLTLAFIVIFLFHQATIQGQTGILNRLLPPEEQSVLAEFNKLYEEAAALFSDADSIKISADILINEKGLAENSEKILTLRENAFRLETNGFMKKMNANQLLRESYNKYIVHLENEPEGENTNILKARLIHELVKEKLFMSLMLRNELNDPELGIPDKPPILKKSLELEHKALLNLENALELLYSSSDKPTNETEPKVREKMVMVDKSLLSMITRELNLQDKESEIYRDLNKLQLNDSVPLGKIKMLLGEEDVSETEVSSGQGNTNVQGTEESGTTQEQTEYLDKIRIPGYKSEDLLPDLNSVMYRVQFATQKSSVLKDTPNFPDEAKEEIMHKVENNWNKFSIGGFDSFSNADQFRKGMDGQESFIFAYRSEEPSEFVQTELAPAKETVHETSTGIPEVTFAGNGMISPVGENIVYKVQIAAKREPMTGLELLDIYKGPKQIIQHRGEGWYRYSIGSCPTYYHADKLMEQTRVKDAWVVAYKGIQRLNAYAMKTTPRDCPELSIQKGFTPGSAPTFRVQIAASITRLAVEELKQIYCGSEKIFEVKSGNYYKYSIGTFSNYKEAVTLKSEVCVPGAFVVAFMEGKPVGIQTAIQKRKLKGE